MGTNSIIDGRVSNGGARVGAGRPKRTGPEVQRYMAARGINPLKAAEILATVADERRIWQRLLASEDERVLLSAMQFLVSMRDGRPAQQINITSVGVNFTAEEIAKARAVIREMTGQTPPTPNEPVGTANDSQLLLASSNSPEEMVKE